MTYRFEDFVLDPEQRQLRRGDTVVPISPRYFDALHLLVAEAGQLVTKDRLLSEVWAGVPVTDEALTQCVRTLRRELGDQASAPRFIATATKHGYRFIAPVSRLGAEEPAREAGVVGFALGGAAGAGLAGVAGGLLYGSLAMPGASMGGASVLSVLLVINVAIGLVGGFGVALGMALGRASLARAGVGRDLGLVIGGAVGGLATGAVCKLFALDLFALLFGAAPTAMTGGAEGLALGATVAAGAVVGARAGRGRLAPVLGAGLAGAAAGAAIILLGGRLMGDSLELLSATFRASRLTLGPLDGGWSRVALGAVEGFGFGAGVIGGARLGWRQLAGARPR
ncbi:winged helix-turn-helix domain-containing protein [Phenylobacterium deserti]|uniref:winged helix-turn-helix domain-containing protein n=1 Tax=Phenylobacterium deserti TaxID=1914756 RepID=UPI001402002F|nr:transcriptional regulator [Phenylobacterium deserti]